TRQHRGGPRAAEEGDAAVTLSDVAETEMESREALREPHAGYDAVQDDSAVALREQSPSAVERRVSRAFVAGREAEERSQPPLRLIRAGLRIDDAHLDLADERSTAQEIDLALVVLAGGMEVRVRVRGVGRDLYPRRLVV